MSNIAEKKIALFKSSQTSVLTFKIAEKFD